MRELDTPRLSMTASVEAAGRPRSAFWSVPPLLKKDAVTVFVFLSMLLIGADRFGLRAGGMTLRAVFPVLVAACSLLYLRHQQNIKFHKTLMILFLLWAIAGAASAVESYDPIKSVGYTIWVLFNFFIIITLFYNYAKNCDPAQTLSLWFLVFRIHSFLIAAEFARYLAVGSITRPYLWFYESSYLAIFMAAYFGSALYMLLQKGRPFLLDFLLATVTMLLVASVTGIFGILFAILINFIVARQRVKLLLGTMAVGLLAAGIAFLFLQDTIYYRFLVGFLFSADTSVLDAILQRGGNRVIRVMVGWQAFTQHPWLGIGIGADNAYMESNAFPEQAWRYIRPWSDVDFGQPFCNVFVSVLGSTGLLGFIPFMGIILYAGVTAVRRILRAMPPEPTAVLVGFFCILLAMQLDGTVQRYYLWSPLGLALGMAAYKNRDLQALGRASR